MGWIVPGIGRLMAPARSESLIAESAEAAGISDIFFLVATDGVGATPSYDGGGFFLSLFCAFSALFFSAVSALFSVFFYRR
jgi:hypothetical protein